MKTAHEVLRNIPEYSLIISKRKIQEHRSYHVLRNRQLGEIDIFFLKKYKNVDKCLLLIDTYSQYIWISIIKGPRTKENVLKAFEDIEKRVKHKFMEIQADKEFAPYASFFSDKGYHVHIKDVSTKCAYAENAIRTVKRKVTFIYKFANIILSNHSS